MKKKRKEKPIQWLVMKNRFKRRLDNMNFSADLQPLEIHKRTQILNKRLKLNPVVTYKDYVKLKTSILRSVEEDEMTVIDEDPSELTANDDKFQDEFDDSENESSEPDEDSDGNSIASSRKTKNWTRPSAREPSTTSNCDSIGDTRSRSASRASTSRANKADGKKTSRQVPLTQYLQRGVVKNVAGGKLHSSTPKEPEDKKAKKGRGRPRKNSVAQQLESSENPPPAAAARRSLRTRSMGRSSVDGTPEPESVDLTRQLVDELEEDDAEDYPDTLLGYYEESPSKDKKRQSPESSREGTPTKDDDASSGSEKSLQKTPNTEFVDCSQSKRQQKENSESSRDNDNLDRISESKSVADPLASSPTKHKIDEAKTLKMDCNNVPGTLQDVCDILLSDDKPDEPTSKRLVNGLVVREGNNRDSGIDEDSRETDVNNLAKKVVPKKPTITSSEVLTTKYSIVSAKPMIQEHQSEKDTTTFDVADNPTEAADSTSDEKSESAGKTQEDESQQSLPMKTLASSTLVEHEDQVGSEYVQSTLEFENHDIKSEGFVTSTPAVKPKEVESEEEEEEEQSEGSEEFHSLGNSSEGESEDDSQPSESSKRRQEQIKKLNLVDQSSGSDSESDEETKQTVESENLPDGKKNAREAVESEKVVKKVASKDSKSAKVPGTMDKQSLEAYALKNILHDLRKNKERAIENSELTDIINEESSKKNLSTFVERPKELNELMQQNIQPVEFEGSLPLQDISENVDVFVFDVPINIPPESFMNKKLTIEDEKLFLDKDVYKTSSKESDVVSCFFSKDKQCKIVNLPLKKSIIVHNKISSVPPEDEISEDSADSATSGSSGTEKHKFNVDDVYTDSDMDSPRKKSKLDARQDTAEKQKQQRVNVKKKKKFDMKNVVVKESKSPLKRGGKDGDGPKAKIMTSEQHMDEIIDAVVKGAGRLSNGETDCKLESKNHLLGNDKIQKVKKALDFEAAETPVVDSVDSESGEKVPKKGILKNRSQEQTTLLKSAEKIFEAREKTPAKESFVNLKKIDEKEGLKVIVSPVKRNKQGSELKKSPTPRKATPVKERLEKEESPVRDTANFTEKGAKKAFKKKKQTESIQQSSLESDSDHSKRKKYDVSQSSALETDTDLDVGEKKKSKKKKKKLKALGAIEELVEVRLEPVSSQDAPDSQVGTEQEFNGKPLKKKKNKQKQPMVEEMEAPSSQELFDSQVKIEGEQTKKVKKKKDSAEFQVPQSAASKRRREDSVTEADSDFSTTSKSSKSSKGKVKAEIYVEKNIKKKIKVAKEEDSELFNSQEQEESELFKTQSVFNVDTSIVRTEASEEPEELDNDLNIDESCEEEGVSTVTMQKLQKFQRLDLFSYNSSSEED